LRKTPHRSPELSQSSPSSPGIAAASIFPEPSPASISRSTFQSSRFFRKHTAISVVAPPETQKGQAASTFAVQPPALLSSQWHARNSLRTFALIMGASYQNCCRMSTRNHNAL
jgi:hypothetical protein